VLKRSSNCKGTVLAVDMEELITRDPGRSIRSLAQEMSIYGTAVRKMVSEDLSYKSCAVGRGQFMSEVSKRTQARIKENLSEVWDKVVWPPSSPGCKNLDYFVWGVSELRVKAKPHNKTEDLVQKIKEVMGRVGNGISFRKNSAEKTRNSFHYSAEESAHSEAFQG
jgi:hypothetical protein